MEVGVGQVGVKALAWQGEEQTVDVEEAVVGASEGGVAVLEGDAVTSSAMSDTLSMMSLATASTFPITSAACCRFLMAALFSSAQALVSCCHLGLEFLKDGLALFGVDGMSAWPCLPPRKFQLYFNGVFSTTN